MRTKVIEVFLDPDATGKVLYVVAAEMNERYKTRLFRNWERISERLNFIRTVKYGSRAKVDALCLTQNS